MISLGSFDSESGYRPMGAFVVISAVMLCVAAKVADVARRPAEVQGRTVEERAPSPAYEIVDADGRLVASFVERYDLVLSPRSLWRAHTPERMAAGISAVLGGDPSPGELLERMLPDTRDGTIDVTDLTLSPRQAAAVLDWIADGGGLRPAGAEGPVPFAGIWVEELEAEPGELPRFALSWQPAVLLSKAERERHGERYAVTWTHRLLDGLGRALGHAPVVEDPTADSAASETCRDQLWRSLMPTGQCRAVQNVAPGHALALRELLDEEGVSSLQMRLTKERDRVHPAGTYEVLGSWGRITGEEPEPVPRGGVELLASRLLQAQQGEHGLEPEPATYRYRVQRNPHLRRAPYYLGRTPGARAPRVETTLDLDLQREVRRHLEAVMVEHRPALAMAMVLELDSGDVLAVDSVEEYEVQPFAPVYYTFTPGSTMKMVTMATALEAGLVTPDEVFDVGHGAYRIPESSRVIREAEGSRTGEITATESFAFSVNAGLVQIGERLDPGAHRAKLLELGYARAPGAGLGVENAGYLPPLPWKKAWTQASISFGHELTTTLWQHAAALATIARGGVWKPLNVLSAVEMDGERCPVEPSAGHRVFREATCAQVRAMMAVGAEVGTGRHIARPDIVMATKTGTAQKVPTEVCAHVEGVERARCAAEQIPWSTERYRALRGAKKPHAHCYTSSMCIVGSLPGDERELLVLVVVDEPRGKQKYGSKVAGPAAAAILAEALGRTRGGDEVGRPTLQGFAPSSDTTPAGEPEPWRRRARPGNESAWGGR